MAHARIIVVGNGGSGKSTVARLLAQKWQLSHIEIDRLASLNGYNDVPIEVVNQRLSEELTSKHRWVVEGMHRLELWRWAIPRTEALLWLDMPRSLILRHLIARALRRAREGRNLLPELRWALKTLRAHERRRSHHRALMSAARSAGATAYHVATPKELENWLDALDETQ